METGSVTAQRARARKSMRPTEEAPMTASIRRGGSDEGLLSREVRRLLCQESSVADT